MPTATLPHVYTTYDSPIGTLLITGNEDCLTGLYIQREKHSPSVERDWIQSDGSFQNIRTQLDEYFAGVRFQFDVQIQAQGTDFQRRVWKALCEIPYGHTCSYASLAARVGNSKASRAVGLANGRNPISIVVPCHRVIGANGSLTGYGGGLEAKKWLLEHEGKFGAPKVV